MAAACSEPTEPTVSCGSFIDDEAEPFAITVENAGDAPIYLASAGCRGAVGFRILGGSGAVTEEPRGTCDLTCGELTTQSAVCAADCAAPVVVQISPGGRYELSWSRRVSVEDTMPSRCYLEPGLAPATCEQLLVALDGDYGVEVDVYDAVTCGGEPCEPCSPDATGACELAPGGARVEGVARIARETFRLPDDGATTVAVP